VIAKPAAFAGGVDGSASWFAWMLVLSMDRATATLSERFRGKILCES
jgi:hypothetical protein